MTNKLKKDPETLPIKLTVENKVTPKDPINYDTSVVKGGILVSALRRLHESNKSFTYEVTVDPNYGLFLESVNGTHGKIEDHTYWEILSTKTGHAEEINVGIGCYTPEANEHIILRFTTWS